MNYNIPLLRDIITQPKASQSLLKKFIPKDLI